MTITAAEAIPTAVTTTAAAAARNGAGPTTGLGSRTSSSWPSAASSSTPSTAHAWQRTTEVTERTGERASSRLRRLRKVLDQIYFSIFSSTGDDYPRGNPGGGGWYNGGGGGTGNNYGGGGFYDNANCGQQQQHRRGGNAGGGFWTGMATGGLMGYMFGNRGYDRPS